MLPARALGSSEVPPDTQDPLEILEWATDRFDRIALATSGGPQSVVVLHLLEQLGRRAEAFVLDTGLLFDETLPFVDQVSARFGVPIARVRPALSVLEQGERFGHAMWRLHADGCCHMRKVVPLARHLKHYDAWIAGLRRDQSATRARVQAVDWDPRHALTKVNPLAFWTRDQVFDHLRTHDLPVHPLLTQGFASVGCRPCTRPIEDASDERAGRWAGSGKTECGIHLPTSGSQP